MAEIDWQQVMGAPTANGARIKRGANVRFFMETREDRNASLEAGRYIAEEVPSISIQWPGCDETVRKISDQDKIEYPELWAAFKAGNEEYVGAGTPLKQWAMLPASICKELEYLGFRTVEQLSEANDSIRGRLGPIWQYVDRAKSWIQSANTPQSEVVGLREKLEKVEARNEKLLEQVELLLQRIEGNEGTRLSGKSLEQSTEINDTPKRRSKRSE
jgi:hypothetical protein